jgi:hypothetical protein
MAVTIAQTNIMGRGKENSGEQRILTDCATANESR